MLLPLLLGIGGKTVLVKYDVSQVEEPSNQLITKGCLLCLVNKQRSAKNLPQVYLTLIVLVLVLWILKGMDFNQHQLQDFLKQSTYLSADETYEDIHPLAFVAKVQSHNADNPTYSDILRCEDEEKKLCNATMIK